MSGSHTSPFVSQEYVLAHTEMPTTLEGAEGAIKKQEDFMTTMDANEEKIIGVVDTGRRLVTDGNINAERAQEKVDSIDQRYFNPKRFIGRSYWEKINLFCHFT